MVTRCLPILIILAAVSSAPVFAATVVVAVIDSQGRPAPNAVVSLIPDSPSGTALLLHAPERGVIDQRHEMFIPLVTVIRREGAVVFTNNDVTMHQVYSFSPIKQFQTEINKGDASNAIFFEKPGVAAIGCNIHDNMVAFVYVSDAPWSAVANASGHLELHDVAEGLYHATVWHPQVPQIHQVASSTVNVTSSSVSLMLSLPFAIEAAKGMNHMHKQDY